MPLKQELRSRIEGPKITGHTGHITVTQRTIDMDASMYRIELSINKTHCKEVQLIATKCLEINCSMKLPGINIVARAPSVNVIKEELVWDVSGRASFPTGRAMDGVYPGENGSDGAGGLPGESGGNVHICCDQLNGGENLTIKSVGGKGGDGQDGGHGQDGRDGEDGTTFVKDDFNQCFPPAAGCSNEVTEQQYLKFAKEGTVKKCLPNTADIYTTFTSNEEERSVTLAIYRNLTGHVVTAGIARRRQAYCLVEGAPGQVGGDGGDGGCRGPAGCGGQAGCVNITKHSDDTIPYGNHGINIERSRGQPGKRGKIGNVGKGGRGGLQGNDIGRMEPNEKEANRITLTGSLNVQYYESEPKNRRLPYCPYKEQYAEITALDNSDRKRQTKGKAGTVIGHRLM